MNRILYPFSAIVGQDAMKTALLLNAVDSTIGGVLIRGQKGTGKSTAARALAALLPPIETVDGCLFHCPPDDPDSMHEGCLERFAGGETLPRTRRATPFVELPLSATEDRIVGTLHIEHALRTGQRRFEPGLLAAANRGILYVDEVNLLDDHLVDMLLDASASGINVVEREGISYSHPARFMLIGTMNPEEGDLRPQFLDRFGLCVSVKGLPSPEDRAEIIGRRMQFEQDPHGFRDEWSEEEQSLSERIIAARERLNSINISDEITDLAVRVALEAEVHGHRTDIALLKTARALAALMERDFIIADDVIEAAQFVLPHRIQNAPLGTPETLFGKIREAISRAMGEIPREKQQPAPTAYEDDLESMQFPGSGAPGSVLFTFLKKKRMRRCLMRTS
ncbi:MAG TPA: ATP-binding protein [bacterium]|nr:ATP-binding protein [bacterium]HQL61940.1 ATP-binding protein [bacterium]